jgi:Holliday junction resolvase
MNKNFIKGKIAESIIERLFIELGYEVYQFGIENIFPSLVNKIKRSEDETSQCLRLMPDFVVYHPEKKIPLFIEVKYREEEELYDDTVEKLRKSRFPFALIILVSKNRINCLSLEEITRDKDRKRFEFDSDDSLLRNNSMFNFNSEEKKIIDSFLKFQKLFFPEKK